MITIIFQVSCIVFVVGCALYILYLIGSAVYSWFKLRSK